jgi:putative ABC transport system permease protein
MRSAFLLGFRTLAREWRSGDLAVLFLALFVAVSALTGVGFLADRIEQGMQLQASEVLGADLRLESPDEIGDRFAAEVASRGLKTARLVSTLSVVLHGDRTQLGNVHAVSADYPLRGKVRTAATPFGDAIDTNGIPEPGGVWLDSRMMSALDARVGDTVTIGSTALRVTRVLISRPDQGSGFSDLAPSLLMNDADLAATKLLQPGSRARYGLLFAGSREQTQQFQLWLRRHSKPAERLRVIAEASPEIGNASQRATRFLSLASLAGVLLCAVAIAMTARRYVKRHLDLAALLKTLGAPQSTVLTVSIVQLVCIALTAAMAGSLAGYLAQGGLLALLRDMMSTELPAPGWRPVFMGVAAALLLLMGFALPSMLQLARVPAIRVLRRDIGPPPLGVMLAYGPAVLAIGLLILWVTGDWMLSLWFIVALALAVLALGIAGWLLVGIVGRLRGQAGVSWRYGAANLARRRAESIVQIVALGLGLSILLLLTIIRGDLIDDWRARLPANAPNYFFVNIPAEERAEFEQVLNAQGGRLSRMLPMIRGRMVAINDVPMGGRRFQDGRGEGFARREQNLTWSAEIGPDNVITAGKWFTAEDHGKPLVSVATDFQESMRLQLGDKLSFDIAGERIDATISSFRQVQWDSLQPNFFLMFPPGLLEGAAGTWMGAAEFRPTDPSSIAQLVRRFPGISIFDMDGLLAQGVVVLLAAVQATRDERRYESAMLRTLGASRRTVLLGVLVEFALIGVLAGVVAAAAASTGAGLIATRQLEIPYSPDPMLWFIGAVSGAVLVCLAGYLSTRSALSQPPMLVLRNG